MRVEDKFGQGIVLEEGLFGKRFQEVPTGTKKFRPTVSNRNLSQRKAKGDKKKGKEGGEEERPRPTLCSKGSNLFQRGPPSGEGLLRLKRLFQKSAERSISSQSQGSV